LFDGQVYLEKAVLTQHDLLNGYDPGAGFYAIQIAGNMRQAWDPHEIALANGVAFSGYQPFLQCRRDRYSHLNSNIEVLPNQPDCS
jgi:hypothetical protein